MGYKGSVGIGHPVFPKPFTDDAVFQSMLLAPCQRSMSQCAWLCLPVFCPVLFVPTPVFMTVTCCFGHRSSNLGCVAPSLPLLPRIFALLGLFWLHVDFRILFTRSMRNTPGTAWNCANLCIVWELWPFWLHWSCLSRNGDCLFSGVFLDFLYHLYY